MFFDIINSKYVVYLLGTPGLIEKVYRKTSKYNTKIVETILEQIERAVFISRPILAPEHRT